MSKLFWQIFKYGMIGSLATLINLVVAEVFAAWVWPCLGPEDVFVKYAGFAAVDLPDARRAVLAVCCNLVGFFVANVACWGLNRKYVFTPGRHHWALEYLLFLAGSGMAIFIGNVLIWALIRFHGVETTWSFMINVLSSVAINFIVRKFVVFKS